MTTERILPAVSLPVPGVRPHRDVKGPGATTRGARPTTARKEAILSTPTRAGMLIGASAAVYAVTLAGVSALQSDADATTAARRAPYAETLAAASEANNLLESALVKVDAEARALANDYGVVGGDIAAYQARLDELAALVAEVQGSAAALPTRISLPSVTMRGAVGGSAPRTTATSGASGAP